MARAPKPDTFAQIAVLIPVHDGNVRGDYAAVCSPASTIPASLRAAHIERHNFYMTHTWEEGNRCNPPHGPRYYVTVGEDVVAYLTLDGHVHFPTVTTAEQGHVQDAVRAAWPARFELDGMGDPVRLRPTAVTAALF